MRRSTPHFQEHNIYDSVTGLPLSEIAGKNGYRLVITPNDPRQPHVAVKTLSLGDA